MRAKIRHNCGNTRSYKDAVQLFADSLAPELFLLVFRLYLDGGLRALTNSNWEKYRGSFRVPSAQRAA